MGCGEIKGLIKKGFLPLKECRCATSALRCSSDYGEWMVNILLLLCPCLVILFSSAKKSKRIIRVTFGTGEYYGSVCVSVSMCVYLCVCVCVCVCRDVSM